MTFSVHVAGVYAWLGFGVSPQSTMTNNGEGSDVMVCSEGFVKRYWMTDKDIPNEADGIPHTHARTDTASADPVCKYSATGSSMTFTRKVASQHSKQHALEVAPGIYISPCPTSKIHNITT